MQRAFRSGSVCLFIALFCVAALYADDVKRVDLILKGGTVHVGDGSPPITADIAIQDGKLLKIGSDLMLGADMVLDCTGLVVCPGFIDLHSHSDGEINER